MSGTTYPYTKLITTEHADKAKFMAMVSASFQPFADLTDLYSTVPNLYDVDLATGEQLDVIGQWVGRNRNLSIPITGVYFTFDTVGLGFDQGVWLGPYDSATGVISLSDQYFRLLIKSAIVNNQWNGSLADAYKFAGEVFNAFGYLFLINDYCNLTMTLEIQGPPNPPPLVIALLTGGYFDIRPAGILISSYIHP
jgi:hypothetical protein